MNIDDRLDKLKRITPVEAPPFLYTRVQQGINALNNTAAPVRWRWAFALTGMIVLILNLAVITRSGKASKNSDMEQVVNTMQLSSSNDLYHE